jgi:hypothetical protein
MKNAMGAKEMHINTRDMVHINVDNLNFSMHVQNTTRADPPLDHN